MARSSKSISRQSARPVARPARQAVDHPDPIEREFLELWLGISRLRERVLGERGVQPVRVRKGKSPAINRKARGQAA